MKAEFQMIQAIVFDFDGLMVDTESSAYDSWQEMYQEYRYTLPLKQWEQVLGGSGAEAELTGQIFDHYALRSRRWERKLALVANEPLLPGIRDAIGYAKEHGLKLGVAAIAGASCATNRAWSTRVNWRASVSTFSSCGIVALIIVPCY